MHWMKNISKSFFYLYIPCVYMMIPFRSGLNRTEIWEILFRQSLYRYLTELLFLYRRYAEFNWDRSSFDVISAYARAIIIANYHYINNRSWLVSITAAASQRVVYEPLCVVGRNSEALRSAQLITRPASLKTHWIRNRWLYLAAVFWASDGG